MRTGESEWPSSRRAKSKVDWAEHRRGPLWLRGAGRSLELRGLCKGQCSKSAALPQTTLRARHGHLLVIQGKILPTSLAEGECAVAKTQPQLPRPNTQKRLQEGLEKSYYHHCLPFCDTVLHRVWHSYVVLVLEVRSIGVATACTGAKAKISNRQQSTATTTTTTTAAAKRCGNNNNKRQPVRHSYAASLRKLPTVYVKMSWFACSRIRYKQDDGQGTSISPNNNNNFITITSNNIITSIVSKCQPSSSSTM